MKAFRDTWKLGIHSWRLPQTQWCYRPYAEAPEVGPLPAATAPESHGLAGESAEAAAAHEFLESRGSAGTMPAGGKSIAGSRPSPTPPGALPPPGADLEFLRLQHLDAYDVRYGVLNCNRQSLHVVFCRIFDERSTESQGKYECNRLIRVALDPNTFRVVVTGLGPWHC